jgi:hypothetical protein
MIPKKEKISKERYRSLIVEHKIVFEGPAPPQDWPTPYEHHFSAIRAIWACRYDEYKKNKNISRVTRRKQKDRVNALREKAYELRKDVNINEATWRASVETFVVERFENSTIWSVFSLFLLLYYQLTWI